MSSSWRGRRWAFCFDALGYAGVNQATGQAGRRVDVAHQLVAIGAGEDRGTCRATLVANTRCVGAQAVDVVVHLACGAVNQDESVGWVEEQRGYPDMFRHL